MTDIGSIVAEIAAEMAQETGRGRVADYIAPLAGVDAARFGLAVVAADGACHLAGDAEIPFSIQ